MLSMGRAPANEFVSRGRLGALAVSRELAAAGHGRVSPEFARLTDMAGEVVDRDQPNSARGLVHRDQWSWAAVHRHQFGAVAGCAAGRG
ncbi:unannotated protein [freshwater metagenome]|uniref:Unannotated protein n=1 Tax=freshwater metagenome TaxID=449393 RepID=A0A6J7R5Z5_9ZZZZ